MNQDLWKTDFYAAVYCCALGDGRRYNEMLPGLMASGVQDSELLSIWSAAFKQAQDDISFEESILRDKARSKAERYFESQNARL